MSEADDKLQIMMETSDQIQTKIRRKRKETEDRIELVEKRIRDTNEVVNEILERLELTHVGHKDDKTLTVSDEEVDAALVAFYECKSADVTHITKSGMKLALEQFLKYRV